MDKNVLIGTNDLGFIFSKSRKVIRKALAKLNIKPMQISQRGNCLSFKFPRQESIKKLSDFFCVKDNLGYSTGKDIPFKIGSVVRVTNIAGNTFIGRLYDKKQYLSHATLENGWRVAIGHDALVELMPDNTPLTEHVWYPTTTDMAVLAYGNKQVNESFKIVNYTPGRNKKKER